jgi:hypothetical protein
MKSRPQILWLLVLAAASLDLAVVRAGGGSTDSVAHQSIVLALAYSQVLMLAAWAALGAASWKGRILAVTVGITAWTWLLDDPDAAVGLIAAVLLALSWGLVGRSFGIRWTSANAPIGALPGFSRDAIAKRNSPRVRPTAWTFSLGQLFIWMTAIVLTLSALRFAYEVSTPSRLFFAGAAVTVLFGAITMVGVAPPANIAAPGAMVPLALFVVCTAMIYELQFDLVGLRTFALLVVMMLAMTKVVRVAGYHVIHVAPWAEGARQPS